VAPGERVCILADTRPEWTYLCYAAWLAGAAVVPIYPTNSPEECEWVASNSEASVVVCENEAQLDKVRAVQERLPNVRKLVLIDGDADDAVPLSQLAGDPGHADEVDRRSGAVTTDDPLLIIYTSGTTGPPKGCVLTHGNGIALCDIVEQLGTIRSGDVSYLYLPLAHVFAQLVQISGLYMGATIAYFGGDTKRIVPELQEVKPDYFASVPRIFEKIYAQVQAKAGGAPPEQVAPAVRAIFGGRLREATTGAAPIAQEILEFLYACGCPVMEGYGMTETTGIGTTNTRADHRFGTVGRPVPGVELEIAADGEILMRGPNIFRGYWRNDDATREVLDENGWLHTGDLGELDADGYLRITGRKKDIIITAGGKNLTPANIENDLKQSPYVSQAVMYGDRRPYPVALVTLDLEEIGPWARERGLPEDLAALSKEPQVIDLVQGVLDEANRKYAQVEQVKRFAILDHDLSQETGELTPTLKVKRNVVYENYADLFDELYARPS
jgi:long-chain acyl-CoA synthetase